MYKNKVIFIPSIFLSIVIISTALLFPILEVYSTNRANDIADDITDDAEDLSRNIGKGLEKLTGKSNSDIDSILKDNNPDSTDKDELEKLYNKCVNTRLIAGLDTASCIDPDSSNDDNDVKDEDDNNDDDKNKDDKNSKN
jgi:hypothetical protein